MDLCICMCEIIKIINKCKRILCKNEFTHAHMDIMDKYSGTVLFKNCPNKKCPKSVYINTPF